MEYVYKLKLPPLDQIVDQAEFDKVFNTISTQKKSHGVASPGVVMKEQWRTILGFQLTRILIFIKTDATGCIHIDELNWTQDTSTPVVWGINWIYNGDAVMDYWRKDLVTNSSPVITNFTTHEGSYSECTVTGPPSKRYKLVNGGAYLVNASVPHRATGLGNRWVFAVRPDMKKLEPSQLLNWNLLVERFNPLIA